MEKSYCLKQDFLPEGIPCDSREWFSAKRPSSVTIHWIGAYPAQTPSIVRAWWLTGGGEASAHLIVKDEEALQCWPFDKVAWHCGSPTGNRCSIGIEVVPESIDGKFSEKSILTLRGILDDFFPDVPLKRHYDWSGKDCPLYYIDEEQWGSLKTALGRGAVIQ